MFELFLNLKESSYSKYKKHFYIYLENDILFYNKKPLLILFDKDDEYVFEINLVFDSKEKDDIIFNIFENYGNPKFHLDYVWDHMAKKDGVNTSFTISNLHKEPYDIKEKYIYSNFLWAKEEFNIICTEFSLINDYNENGFFVKFLRKII